MKTVFTVLLLLICICNAQRNARVPAMFAVGEEKDIDARLIGCIGLINTLQSTAPILKHQVPTVWDNRPISGKNDRDIVCCWCIVAPWICACLKTDDGTQLCRDIRVLVRLMPQTLKGGIELADQGMVLTKDGVQYSHHLWVYSIHMIVSCILPPIQAIPICLCCRIEVEL